MSEDSRLREAAFRFVVAHRRRYRVREEALEDVARRLLARGKGTLKVGDDGALRVLAGGTALDLLGYALAGDDAQHLLEPAAPSLSSKPAGQDAKGLSAIERLRLINEGSPKGALPRL